jgi:hypothetical protein
MCGYVLCCIHLIISYFCLNAFFVFLYACLCPQEISGMRHEINELESENKKLTEIVAKQTYGQSGYKIELDDHNAEKVSENNSNHQPSQPITASFPDQSSTSSQQKFPSASTSNNNNNKSGFSSTLSSSLVGGLVRQSSQSSKKFEQSLEEVPPSPPHRMSRSALSHQQTTQSQSTVIERGNNNPSSSSSSLSGSTVHGDRKYERKFSLESTISPLLRKSTSFRSSPTVTPRSSSPGSTLVRSKKWGDMTISSPQTQSPPSSSSPPPPPSSSLQKSLSVAEKIKNMELEASPTNHSRFVFVYVHI